MSVPYTKQLAYIESTGTQYIDTGFKPNQDTRIVATMQCVTSTNYGRLFGCGTYNSLNSVMTDYEVGITGTLCIKYGNKASWTTTSIHGDYEKHTYDFNKNNFYLDNELVSSNTYGAFQSTSNLGIFTYINGNNVGQSTEFFIGRLYSFQIYDNDVLVRDYIPVRVGQEGCLYDKVSGELFKNAGTGDFVYKERPEHSPLTSNIRRRLLYAKPKKVYDYLCFTALESGTFSFTIPSVITTDNHVSFVEYSLDEGKTWVKTDNIQNAEVVITTPTIQQGNRVFWRGIAKRYANAGNNVNNCSRFSSTCRFNVSGNIMSLLYKKDFSDKLVFPTDPSSGQSWYVFCYLFYNCTGLVEASNLSLPANELAAGSYCSMFEGCTNLTDASFDLPAEFVRGMYEYNGAYRNMFYGCTGLLYPPTIKATSCSNYGLQGMFYNCSSMVIAPDMHFTSVAHNSMNNMFYGCSSITSVQNIGNIETTVYGCYANMFQNCTSLVSVSKNLLPALTLEGNCYIHMFRGCVSLVNAPDLPATTLASNCYSNMFRDCISLTDVPSILPSLVLENNCYDSMFYGCTSLEKAPELPAITLVNNCYAHMLRGCTSLNYIKMMATNIEVGNPLSYWVYQVASNGTFVRNPNATWWVIGESGIPNGWLLEDGTEQSDEVIVFEDAEAKRVITSRYGGVVPDATYSSHWPIRIKGKVDGEITYRQASHIASITEAFYNNTELIKFHEFQYFTAIDGSGSRWFRNCKTLQEITLPNKDNLAIADSAFYQCRDITVFNNWDKVTTLNNDCLREATGDFKTLVANLDFTKIEQWGGSVIFGNNEIISLYLPNVRIITNFYELDNCTLIDIGHNIPIEFGTLLFWGWAAHECNLVFRCPAVIKTNWNGMDMHNSTTSGTILNLYVYEKYYDDYANDAYWSTADNIYKIGGAEWVAQFSSSNEWADYPNGQAPNVDFTESEVEYARPLVGVNFDTKVIPTSNTHVVVRCRMTSTLNGAIIGLYESNSIRYVIQHLNSRFYFEVGSTAKNINTDTNIHIFELYGNGTYVIDGTSYDIGDTLGTTTLSIALFSRRGTNNSYGYQATNCELYYAKIYEGETLVKDYVPYRYRGGIYLKDKVSGKLEWLGYEDNFEIGNDVNS